MIYNVTGYFNRSIKSMNEFTATEAKARLADLLRTVENGETIAITRHGKTVAHLVPASSAAASAKEEALKRFARRRRRWKPTGASVDDILAWRHEDHRF